MMLYLLKLVFLVSFINVNDGNSDIELLIKKKPGVKPFDGHKVVRAFPSTQNEVDKINSLESDPSIEVDFWSRNRNTDVQVGPNDFEKLTSFLKNSNINYKIINDNLQASLDEEERAHYRHSKGWHGEYHQLDQIVQHVNNFARIYAARTKLLTIGKTFEKRDIVGLEICGSQDIPNKQKVVIICGQHAREWISPATCLYIMDKLLTDYQREERTTAMVDRFNWVVFPVLNPDGYAYTWSGESHRLWRKNREPTKNPECHGVDLNRNWGYKWGVSGASSEPCSDVYKGVKPFSALETQAISNYIQEHRMHVFSFIDVHAYSQLWMYPWGYTTRKLCKDKHELERVSNISVAALKAKHNTNFEAGPAGIIIYEASGGSKDWAYGIMGLKYAFALELRDTGRHGFLLPKEQILPTGEETFASLQAMALEMRDYSDKTTLYYDKSTFAGQKTHP